MKSFNNDKPIVDIILPNYNKFNFLEEAINSVVNQTFNKWRLHIIDDCSTDNSWSIIKKFSDQSNINIIKLKKNMGPSFCRNYAIRISNLKYISFIDSDDTWERTKLKKQIDFMELNNFDFTYTDYRPFFEKNGKRIFKEKTSLRDTFDFNSFIKNSSINTTTMIIKRSVLGTLKFKKIKLMEDYLFKCRLLKKKYVAKKLNENLATYRILLDSRSSKRIKNIFWLWNINKTYNNLNFFKNMMSVISISINSIKKYGLK